MTYSSLKQPLTVTVVPIIKFMGRPLFVQIIVRVLLAQLEKVNIEAGQSETGIICFIYQLNESLG